MLVGMAKDAASFVAEWFWPDVDEAAVQELDARVARSAAEPTRAGHQVRYLGSLLMREDEVVVCHFEGAAEAVRATPEQARIPFERILETTRSDGYPAVRHLRG
jgi:hypothetical protein